MKDEARINSYGLSTNKKVLAQIEAILSLWITKKKKGIERNHRRKKYFVGSCPVKAVREETAVETLIL